MADMNEMLEPVFGGEQNLSMGQRALYVAGGLGLAAAAVKPRPNPLLNVLAMAGGAYLALSGYTGRCPIRAALMEGDGGPLRALPDLRGERDGGAPRRERSRQYDYAI